MEIKVRTAEEMMELWSSYVIEWNCTDADAWINNSTAFATNGIDYILVEICIDKRE